MDFRNPTMKMERFNVKEPTTMVKKMNFGNTTMKTDNSNKKEH